MFSVVLSFAIIGVIAVRMVDNGYTLGVLPCCNSLYPTFKNYQYATNFSIEDLKPCYVVNEYAKEDKLRIGDIVYYKYNNNESITHRIVDTCTYKQDITVYRFENMTYEYYVPVSGFVLQGDNPLLNPIPDQYGTDNCVPSWSVQYRVKYKLLCLADWSSDFI